MTKPEKSRGDASTQEPMTERRRRALFRPARHRPPVVTEFQSDAIEVENRAPPRIARMTLYCVLALILAAIGWASGSQVDMIVTAQGKLVTTRPNLVVQPLETSVVREIHVRPGDRVNRGDLLATLDPTFSQADLDQLRGKVGVFNAAIDRLKAEVNSEDYVIGQSINADQVLQRKIFLQRKATYDAQMENYERADRLCSREPEDCTERRGGARSAARDDEVDRGHACDADGQGSWLEAEFAALA